jgi:Na+/H+ antiporter NhaD/arsenite permease-like protein
MDSFHHYLSLIVFLICYALFVALPLRRTLVACIFAGVLVLTGTMPLHELPTAINWNVMGIFVGMLVVADVFIESRYPAYLAEHIVNKAPNMAFAMLFMCVLTGVISAFVENVATVLIVAPIALEMARRLKFSPVAMMIGIAISSNLQGAATLIGDPPSMLLAGHAKMNFMDFFFYEGKPGIFFAVQVGAAFTVGVLYWLYREHRENVSVLHEEKVVSWVPPIALLLLIVLLALSSFFDQGFSYLAGLICMIFGAAMLVWGRFAMRAPLWESFKKLDWDSTFFLMAIFVLVESLALQGWTDKIADVLSHTVGGNVLIGYTMLVFVSVVVSAFVDNVPYLMAMLPVADKMAVDANVSPTLFLFGLLIGASLGGNVTPVGASANIVGIALLKKEGYHVTFREWARIAVPFTIAAVVPAYFFIWWIWS